MKLIKKIDSNIELFKIIDQFYIHRVNETKILKPDTNFCFEYDSKSRPWYDKSFIYILKNGEYKVFDQYFNLKRTIENELITIDGSNLIFFGDENYFLINHTFDKIKRELIIQNVIYLDRIIHEQNNFWGIILSLNYRINFPDGTFSNPSKFSCSDLLGENIFWKYDCPEGFQAKNTWIIRGDYLLFSINKKGYFAGKFIKLNITTGIIKWQVDVKYTDMIYNETQGIFVSFWAGNNNGNNYQIIDIDNETVEIGQPITDYVLANVNTFGQMQFLEESKLYFADNVHSYGENTVPIKFGCFDIKSKKVIFLQEIPIEYGIQISQMIYNDAKLYIRMTMNTLLIYEDS